MKRLSPSLLALALAACTGTSGTGTSGIGTSGIDAMLAVHDDHPVQVAALVVDLDSGETLVEHDAQRLFRPASTMKLLPTSAICRRDAAGEFVTILLADEVPEGNVWLVGGGDPLLSSEDVGGLVGQLRAAGLQHAIGGLHVADPLLGEPRFGEGWMWDDEPASFMPPLSGAAVDGGCVTVDVRRIDGEERVRLLPTGGSLELQVVPGPTGLGVSRGRYHDAATVRVTGGLGERSEWQRQISVPDPARHTGHVLAAALRAEGVRVEHDSVEVARSGDAPMFAGATEALRVRPVAEVVTHTNKVSDNLGAELLLRRLGALQNLKVLFDRMADDGVPADQEQARSTTDFERGREQVVEDLRRLGVAADAYRIADGSGVSHYNLLSADLLVRLLVDMHRTGGEPYALFRRSLPIAGVDGTLQSRMKQTAAEGRVFAKTGTVSAVSNLAGYVDTKSGRRLAFAILCQNFVGSARPWRELQDRICAQLAEL